MVVTKWKTSYIVTYVSCRISYLTLPPEELYFPLSNVYTVKLILRQAAHTEILHSNAFDSSGKSNGVDFLEPYVAIFKLALDGILIIQLYSFFNMHTSRLHFNQFLFILSYRTLHISTKAPKLHPNNCLPRSNLQGISCLHSSFISIVLGVVFRNSHHVYVSLPAAESMLRAGLQSTRSQSHSALTTACAYCLALRADGQRTAAPAG